MASPSAGAPALNYGDVNTETTSPGEAKGLIDNYRYDYNEKCLESCDKGSYNDEINPSIIRCKCELDKCQ